MVRKIGADVVYGRLDMLESDRARSIFDDIKHVPQLQAVAERLRATIVARTPGAARALDAAPVGPVEPVGRDGLGDSTNLCMALRHIVALQYDLPTDWLLERVRELLARCASFEQ